MAVGVLGSHHNFLVFFLFSPTFSLLIFLFSYFCGTDIGLTPCKREKWICSPGKHDTSTSANHIFGYETKHCSETHGDEETFYSRCRNSIVQSTPNSTLPPPSHWLFSLFIMLSLPLGRSFLIFLLVLRFVPRLVMVSISCLVHGHHGGLALDNLRHHLQSLRLLLTGCCDPLQEGPELFKHLPGPLLGPLFGHRNFEGRRDLGVGCSWRCIFHIVFLLEWPCWLGILGP